LAQPEPAKTGTITLDELLALNDEIAALVRSGVPLERGLAELGGDLPGRLGALAATLAERTGRGEPLLQVLAEQSAGLPPVYRAVVEAGVRSGRLPSALESLATSLRRLAETRRGIVAALIYPLLVLLLACGMFAFFSRGIAPAMAATFEPFRTAGRAVFATWTAWGSVAGYAAAIVPLLILILAAAWWYQSRRAAIADPRRSALLLGWLPWVGETLRCSQTAAFAEVLALLVESEVPLPTGVVLAAQSCGNPRLISAATQLAERLQRGETLGTNVGQAFQPDAESAKLRPESPTHRTGAEFPPLLRWLMAAGQRQGALLPALKHAAETYRRRAEQQADLVRVLLPVVLTVAIGGSATALYALSLFVPYTSMLRALAGVY
jgi:general secretion pathway protein F